ncbi:hypothetical protein AGOR_G00243200 [Albula goreensis]|uniref:Uncharacterized protein n=1 Tax=Albula goreensis TaxID=1534307 RepID=A0A8T3CIK5_9TELE|nr:hypothetical protein AGOR_G00243200 [Albula goreensis]
MTGGGGGAVFGRSRRLILQGALAKQQLYPAQEELPEPVPQEEVEGRVYNAVGEDDGVCDDVGAFQALNEEAPVHTNPRHEEDAGVQVDMEDTEMSEMQKKGETHVVKTEELFLSFAKP